jgi:hypothetical protein
MDDKRPANDNTCSSGPPVVHTPRHRPDATYARSANVILPLRFAERMPGWHLRDPPAEVSRAGRIRVGDVVTIRE